MSTDVEALFFEVFEALPRQGPGLPASTQRAYELCRELPAAPRIADLGCGSGAQTFDLAALTDGTIVAVDAHEPLVDRLRAAVAERGLGDRVQPVLEDMSVWAPEPSSFHLVWSEGALYSIGLPAALSLCDRLLAPGGYLVFTEAVWRVEDPSESAQAMFADYPTMGSVPDVLELSRETGWELIDHFPLPDAGWWTHFYGPMEARIDALRLQHAHDPAALDALDQLAAEPELHRQCGHEYGYEFIVLQKPNPAA